MDMDRKVFKYSEPMLLVVMERGEIVVKVPEDIGIELGRVSEENWQLLFSRFLRRELEEIREIESIVSKSKNLCIVDVGLRKKCTLKSFIYYIWFKYN